MKKLFLSLAVICSVALVSCDGNKEAANDSVADTQTEVAAATNEEEVTAPNDSTIEVTDTTVAVETPAE